jgi:hypothetical protein
MNRKRISIMMGAQMAKTDTERRPTATQWGRLDLVRLRKRIPVLKKRLARLQRAKIVSQKTLKSEISV